MIEIKTLMSRCLNGIFILFKSISIIKHTPGAIVPAITLIYLKLPSSIFLSNLVFISKLVSSFIELIPEKLMKYINIEMKVIGMA